MEDNTNTVVTPITDVASGEAADTHEAAEAELASLGGSQEPVTEVAEVVSPQEEIISPKPATLSSLAKRERKLLDRENSLKATETKLQSYEQFAELLQKNPVDVLAQLGWTEDKLADAILAKRNGTEVVDPQVGRLEALEKKLADQEANRIKQEQDTNLSNIQTGIKNQITADTERFDLINSLDQHDEVFSAVLEYTKKYPEWRPTNQEATNLVNTIADKIEAELDRSLLSKVKTSKKFMKSIGQSSSSPASQLSALANKQTITSPTKKPQTLTNNNVRNNTPTEDGLSMNASDRWDQLFRGQPGYK